MDKDVPSPSAVWRASWTVCSCEWHAGARKSGREHLHSPRLPAEKRLEQADPDQVRLPRRHAQHPQSCGTGGVQTSPRMVLTHDLGQRIGLNLVVRVSEL